MNQNQTRPSKYVAIQWITIINWVSWSINKIVRVNSQSWLLIYICLYIWRKKILHWTRKILASMSLGEPMLIKTGVCKYISVGFLWFCWFPNGFLMRFPILYIFWLYETSCFQIEQSLSRSSSFPNDWGNYNCNGNDRALEKNWCGKFRRIWKTFVTVAMNQV